MAENSYVEMKRVIEILLAYIFRKGYLKCNQIKVDLMLEEMSDALLFSYI